jgi:plasmid segregation protein ParM
MKTSVFAVDVGYGNTKYAYRAASGTVATGMFPSLAPLAASRTLSGYGEGVLAARKVITITIDESSTRSGPTSRSRPLTAIRDVRWPTTSY